MPTSAEYLNYVAELLAPLGAIRHQRMFGGAGVYCDGVMMALVADDCLYLKADAINRPDFEREGLAPFTYEAKGKRASLSYWRAPDEALESAAILLPWARGALAAALRARK